MISPERPYSNLGVAHEFLDEYRPTDWHTFELAVSQGFGDMWLNQGISWIDFNRLGTPSENNPRIEKENWDKDHRYFREGVSYRDGMTEGQAFMLAREHDKDQFYNFWFKNVGAWEATRIGGYLVGSLPDPLNFLPLGVGIPHLVRAGNFAYKAMQKSTIGSIASVPSKALAKISQEGVEASIYAGLASSVILGKQNVFEQEYGLSDVGMDMAFAFGAGFAIGNFARAGRTFKDWSASKQQGRIIEEAQRLGGGDTPKGGPDGPTLDPEETPMQGPSQRTTAEEMQRINEQTRSYDQQANNELNVQNVIDSVKQDPTVNLVVDNVVDTLDKLGDRFYYFVDLVTNCINGKGAGSKK